ncbi:NADP-dependent isocitrate dehydrogenase, partial [Pseudomonas syringae pv. tagetis]|uniref:NADP-dependent isocitrate dehydrogenase n=1 Tax=Pseudomonas syringae group genomosp. 7 TaxID=251699 RepID=UPI00376F824B
RAPLTVKHYAPKHPHKIGASSADSKAHVAHMSNGDIYGSEKAAEFAAEDTLKIELIDQDCCTYVLKEKTAVKAREV